jgi:predicted nucleic-acid-binding Zn-ribbon protein
LSRATCPKCGSTNVEFRREFAGSRGNTDYYRIHRGTGIFVPAGQKKSERKRQYRTILFCKNCGYTSTERTDEKHGIGCIGIFFLITLVLLIFGAIRSCTVSMLDKGKTKVYTVDDSNVYLVDNPSSERITKVLRKIEDVKDYRVASKENDPNNLLSGDTGCTAVVFFQHKDIELEKGETIIEKGTDAGGCIEVFATQEAANARLQRLNMFSFAGYNQMVGTVIVRTSFELPKKKRKAFNNEICVALLED